MNAPWQRRCIVWLVSAAAAAVTACASHPPADAFPMGLPASLDATKPLAVVGDLQATSWLARRVMGRESTRAAQERLVADLQEQAARTAALVIVGDLVFNARSRSDWRRFDGFVAPIARRVPVLPAIGNHDYYCVFVQECTQRVVPKNFRRRFPWFGPGIPYTVAYGDLLLVFLDSETDLDEQGRWFDGQRERWRSRYAGVLIFLHRAPYTDSVTRGAIGDATVAEQIASRITAREPAAIVITGHIHGYEHLLVDGIHYFITAGGGGPRGLLGAERPDDVYAGPDCFRDEWGRVRRPFNYLLIERRAASVDITARGFCPGDAAITTIEQYEIPLPHLP
jgi:UDP-2,3-diacylglucosamine pyrophosphatase LpxH